MPKLEISWNGHEYAASPWDTDAHMAMLDEIDAELSSQRTTLREATSRITKALKADPYWIDGLLERANLHDEANNYSAAETDRRRAYDIACATVPADLAGELPWLHVPNRPLLRAMAAWAIAQVDDREYATAAAIADRLLKLNPNDNQGMRLVKGPALLRCGNTAAARKSLTETAEQDPGMRHELALLQFEEGDFVSAVTTLRRALVENPYIAETLLTGYPARPMPVRQTSNMEGRDGAADYSDHWREQWATSASALSFLRWVQTHPRLMRERGHCLEPAEGLLWETDPDARFNLINVRKARLEAIDDELSRELVTNDAAAPLDRKHRPWSKLETGRRPPRPRDAAPNPANA